MRLRLRQAALDLYRRRGFDETTTAEIAAKAKVTERTFFRHFADKREVLFDGEAALRSRMIDAMNELPDELAPLETLLHAYRAAVPLVEENRSFSEPRAIVIAKTPALRERALAKIAALNEALAATLRSRGVGEGVANLATEVAAAAWNHAARAWGEDPSASLDALVVQAFDSLRDLSATKPAARSPTTAAARATRRRR